MNERKHIIKKLPWIVLFVFCLLFSFTSFGYAEDAPVFTYRATINGEQTDGPSDTNNFFMAMQDDQVSVQVIIPDSEQTEGVTYTYQWYLGFEEKAENETTDTIVLDTSFGNWYEFWCEVTKHVGDKEYSNTVKIQELLVIATHLIKPTINSELSDVEYQITDEPEAMKADATVKDGLACYQWYKNDVKSTDGATAIEGATSQTYKPVLELGDTYYYYEVWSKNDNVTPNESEHAVSNIAKISVNQSSTFLEGDGTEDKPFQINNYDDLLTVSETVKAGTTFTDQYFLVQNNIELAADWPMIGGLKEGETEPRNGKNICPFSGIFDGGSHKITSAEGGNPLFGYVRAATIKNLDIAGADINGCGLIRNYDVDYGSDGTSSTGVPATATIDNVTIKSGTSIRQSGFISGMVAAANTVDIRNCTVEEGVEIGSTKKDSRIGSFAGDFCGTITNCRSAATVYGAVQIGGLVGSKSNAMNPMRISNSVFTGTIEATGNSVGGILGISFGGNFGGIESAPNGHAAEIVNCLVTGNVTGNDQVGGILGYESIVQPWDEKHIQSNLFTGSLTAGEGAFKGGTIGYCRGLDKCNIISDNFFAGSSGADRGIGGVKYLDTSCDTHETKWGENYFDSSKSIPTYEGVNDIYTNNLRPDFNRTDDPLGADADKLAKSVSAAELSDGTVVRLLNKAEGSLHNWKQGSNTPEISDEPVAYQMTVADDYKSVYNIGDSLDLSGLEFHVTWSDGKEETVTGDDANMEITGFDSSQQGFLTLTAVYGAAKAEFQIKVIKSEADAEPIKVTFTLLGDKIHGESDAQHTRSAGNLETWIPSTAYEVTTNSTAMDVILAALEENHIGHEGNGNNQFGSYYISGVQIPNSEEYLREFSNGTNSGWMYAVNDEEPEVGVNQYFLNDGDEIIMFYTDDYTYEKSSYEQNKYDKAKAEGVISVIDELPTSDKITLADQEKIKELRAQYEALTDAQKNYVPDEVLKKLEDAEKAIEDLLKAEEKTPAKKAKKANPMKVKAVKTTYKVKALKKKAKSFKAVKVTGAKGKVTYVGKPVGKKAKKFLKFNKKTGKITVKKGAKKGKYVMKVTVKAAGNKTYKAGKKTVKVVVKVKK